MQPVTCTPRAPCGPWERVGGAKRCMCGARAAARVQRAARRAPRRSFRCGRGACVAQAGAAPTTGATHAAARFWASGARAALARPYRTSAVRGGVHRPDELPSTSIDPHLARRTLLPRIARRCVRVDCVAAPLQGHLALQHLPGAASRVAATAVRAFNAEVASVADVAPNARAAAVRFAFWRDVLSAASAKGAEWCLRRGRGHACRVLVCRF